MITINSKDMLKEATYKSGNNGSELLEKRKILYTNSYPTNKSTTPPSNPVVKVLQKKLKVILPMLCSITHLQLDLYPLRYIQRCQIL